MSSGYNCGAKAKTNQQKKEQKQEFLFVSLSAKLIPIQLRIVSMSLQLRIGIWNSNSNSFATDWEHVLENYVEERREFWVKLHEWFTLRGGKEVWKEEASAVAEPWVRESVGRIEVQGIVQRQLQSISGRGEDEEEEDEDNIPNAGGL